MNTQELQENLLRAVAEKKKGNYTETEHIANNLIASIEKGSSSETDAYDVAVVHAAARRLLGIVELRRGKYSESIEHLNASIAISEASGDDSGTALALSTIGTVYTSQSDYPRAMNYHQRVQIICESLGEKDGVARSLGNIGTLFYYLGDYENSLDHLSKAMLLHEEIGHKEFVAADLANLGVIHLNLNQLEQALSCFERAFEINKQLGNKVGMSFDLRKIGNINQRSENYTMVMEYYSRAMLLSKELSNQVGIARCHMDFGGVHTELQQYDLALGNYERSLQILQGLGHKNDCSVVLGAIGSLYAQPLNPWRDEEKAEKFFLDSIALDEEIGRRENETYKSLSELYEQQGRVQESLAYFKRFYELEKEVHGEEVKKAAQRYQIERERAEVTVRLQTTEQLLNKTLPPSISSRLINGEKNIADKFESVTILFADIVGFTPLISGMKPQRVVELLNNLFSRFDQLTETFGVERIKTIGDAYMAVSGAPEKCEDHALRMANVAFGMLEQIQLFNHEVGAEIHLRIGINCGEVIAAIIGESKFAYDLWSDAVNTASRMESHGEAGRIHVTEEFKVQLGDSSFQFSPRAEMHIKGKGMMKTYFIEK